MALEMNDDVLPRSFIEITLDPRKKSRFRLMRELYDQGVSSKRNPDRSIELNNLSH